MRIHLLGVRRHLYPNPVCRRRSLARKIRLGAEADQAEAHESFINYGHGRRVVLGMGVTRGREKGTVAIIKNKYTKSLLVRDGMGSCNSTYTPGVGKELSIHQPK